MVWLMMGSMLDQGEEARKQDLFTVKTILT